MGPEERLQRAGFRKEPDVKGDCCLFCNYLDTINDGEQYCEQHRVIFWDGFIAGEYVCGDYNGSLMESLFEEIRKEGSEASAPSYQKQNVQSSQSEGCYIATAVYGDYDAPEVLTLRMYRDIVLKKTLIGRAFIRLYYATSPKLASKLKGHTFINSKIKKILERMVYKINRRFKQRCE